MTVSKVPYFLFLTAFNTVAGCKIDKTYLSFFKLQPQTENSTMPGKLHCSLVEMFMAAGVDEDTGLKPCKMQVLIFIYSYHCDI